MEPWNCYTISDLFDVKNGAGIKSCDFSNIQVDDSYMEVFKIGHIAIGGGLRAEPKKNYVKINDKLKKFILNKGDIVMAMTDMKDNVTILGVPAMVDCDNRYILNQRVACLRKKENIEFDDRFVYYQMRTKRYLLPLQKQANRGVQVNLTTEHIKNSRIYLPDIGIQREISSLLASLDNKIICNRDINENLEQLATALFKSWFVDFDQFQNCKFVDSELGMIPEGWKVGSLDNIAEFKRGKTITKSNTEKGNIPVVAGGLSPAYYHSKSNTSERVITISASGANAGYTKMYFSPIWASDCSFVDNISTQYIHTAYCFLLLNRKKVNSLQWGAAQPHVYAKDINKLLLVIPPENILQQFEDIVKEIFNLSDILHKENSNLSILFDTLLSKLMSGQFNL